jgi:quinolinate synthase
MLSTCNDLASSEKSLYKSGLAQWQAPRRPGQERLSPEYTRLSQDELDAKIAERRRQLGERLIILGHHYQRDDVIKYADVRGDSFKLSRLAASRDQAEYILFCGVHFMAESADILSAPHQQVILPNLAAGCSMADMANIDDVEACWADVTRVAGGDTIPVTYMNSAASLKAFCGRHGGIVCTSSNADNVLRWAFERGRRVLFFPDQHLGRNTGFKMGIPLKEMHVWDPRQPLGGNSAAELREARIILWKGHCSVHQRFTPEQIDAAREEDPSVNVLVHPECTLDVVQRADFVGSTEYIVQAIERAAPGSSWAVATEINLVKRLAQEHPDKRIFCLDPIVCPCSTMYRIHPAFIAWALDNLIEGRVVNRIVVAGDIAAQARTALDRMLSVA